MTSTLHRAVTQSWSLSPHAWGAGAFLAMDEDEAVDLVQEGGRAWAALTATRWQHIHVFDPRLFLHAELQRIFRDAGQTPSSLGGLAMFWLAFDARQGLPLAEIATLDPYFVQGAYRVARDAPERSCEARALARSDLTVPSPRTAPHARTLQRWAAFLRASPAVRLEAVWAMLARDLPWEFATLSATAPPSTHGLVPRGDTPLRASSSVVFSHLLAPPHG